MTKIEWSQVNGWRLNQQFLTRRATPAQMLEVFSRLAGLQAQLLSAAELQLWVRVESLMPTDVSNALWQERTVVKSWAMRGTLHLLAATDFGLFIAARQAFPIHRPPSYFKYHQLTPAEFTAIVETVPAVLSAEGMSREQLAEAVVTQTGNENLRQVLLSGWGALLKPVAFEGQLCFGPDDGQRVTFVRPDLWLGAWPEVEPQQAIQEVARRFLRSYGPATADEFARWWGITAGQAKKVFKALDDEVTEVKVEGWSAWALTVTLEALLKTNPARSVRLLPHFDPYTIAVARHYQYLMPDEYKARVYRPQGWISPVIMVDGRLAGVWEVDKKRSPPTITVDLFGPVRSEVQAGIEAEARRLAEFWGDDVSLMI